MPNWSVVASPCAKVVASELACMVCDVLPAVGHAIVSGGKFDGRVLFLFCGSCLSDAEDMERVVDPMMINLVGQGFIRPDGGPGPNGNPTARHGDHWDEISSEYL